MLLRKLKNRLFGGPTDASDSPASSTRSEPAEVAQAGRPMRIARLVRETTDALTLVLEPLDGVATPFQSGQFLNLQVELPGGAVWRAYSLCSAPHAGELAVTVKRIEGGRASSYLHQHASVGQVLQVRGPSGSFVLPPTAAPRHLLLIAGGSGITPMMSHTHHVLAREPNSRITLLYGNRGESDIIFRAALEQLQEQHGGRLALRHVLSEPSATLSAGVGMLDGETAQRELAALGFARTPPELCLLCGPTPMMSATRAALLALGVPESRILEERFSATLSNLEPGAASEQRVRVRLQGQETEFKVAAGETILEASQRTRLTLDFSCATGDCGTCAMRLTAGRVDMPEHNALTDAERAAGVILPCVSRPLSSCSLEPV